VNATLPTAQPDVILLSLVRRHSGMACGSETITASAPRAIETSRVTRSGWTTPSPVVRAPRIAERASSRLAGSSNERQPAQTAAPETIPERFAASRMSLGAGPRPVHDERPVTTAPQPADRATARANDPEPRRIRQRAERRIEQRSPQRRSSRRSRTQWKKNVFAPINLSGS